MMRSFSTSFHKPQRYPVPQPRRSPHPVHNHWQPHGRARFAVGTTEKKMSPFAVMQTVVAGMMAMLVAGCANAIPSSGVHLSVHPSTVAHPKPIGVVEDGWHTELLLPATEAESSLSDIRPWFPKEKYLIFGWGNRYYYMARDPGWLSGLDALFPSSSVMLIQGLSENPQKVFPPDIHIRWLCISGAGLAHMDAYLAGYLRGGGPNGGLIELRHGPWAHSWFFASTGTYDAFHTCNTWTARALHIAGLPVGSQGVVFADQVVSEVATLHRCTLPGAPVSHATRHK